MGLFATPPNVTYVSGFEAPMPVGCVTEVAVDAATAAFYAALTALRPGRRCCDAHAAASETLERHGLRVEHYTGHQIGVGPNDPPRLVPYDETVLQAGMVIAVEPGVYAGRKAPYGACAEQMVLVTVDGPEILTAFPWGL